ncbi:MAG: hypothetical protein HN580_05300 [Deltaproteobacteria bacterium]|jgi:hypothetical protein|nr:hypothetical protein [Deltaproteobacteria bacterium]MBT4266449.1 hypothetical protein [Deltaproteobacteria bacterium]MBT6499394.1 hypothetical protein [Deltaproteobacteria bacterium]MBT7715019.1 hypothetical protein [Deltaproteobacteria bacterium]MBT7888412.1 hypothetical protein [Deltaproteobacteria bacterium]
MPEIGTILKSQTENAGTIFYRVISIDKTSYTIKSLCKIRKGFQTTKYGNGDKSQILKSEVGFNYLEITRKENTLIKKIIEMNV